MKELAEFQQDLVKWIRRTRPTIYTTVRHVSASGMLRVIDVFVIKKGRPLSLNYLIETYGLYKRDKQRSGVRVSGCGMDMGFAVVYELSSSIFPKGFNRRKSEHHRNNDPSNHDKDGGYALKQEWL